MARALIEDQKRVNQILAAFSTPVTLHPGYQGILTTNGIIIPVKKGGNIVTLCVAESPRS